MIMYIEMDSTLKCIYIFNYIQKKYKIILNIDKIMKTLITDIKMEILYT